VGSAKRRQEVPQHSKQKPGGEAKCARGGQESTPQGSSKRTTGRVLVQKESRKGALQRSTKRKKSPEDAGKINQSRDGRCARLLWIVLCPVSPRKRDQKKKDFHCMKKKAVSRTLTNTLKGSLD